MTSTWGSAVFALVCLSHSTLFASGTSPLGSKLMRIALRRFEPDQLPNQRSFQQGALVLESVDGFFCSRWRAAARLAGPLHTQRGLLCQVGPKVNDRSFHAVPQPADFHRGGENGTGPILTRWEVFDNLWACLVPQESLRAEWCFMFSTGVLRHAGVSAAMRFQPGWLGLADELTMC